MPQRISRRDFTKRAAGVAAGIAAAPLLRAQAATPSDKPPVSDAEIQAVQDKLAKPLSEEAKKILHDDLSSQKTDTKNRLKTRLPENSEPCFTYVPTSKEGRS